MSELGLQILAEARRDCRICMRQDPGLIFNGSQESFDPPVVSYWSQWLGHPRPELLIVGQDFSDIGYFVRNRGRDEVGNKTNDNLRLLLAEAGVSVGLAPLPDAQTPVFLTNSVLCLKNGAMNAPLKDRWVRSCALNHLRPLVQQLKPRLIVGMGKHGWSAVRQTFDLRSAPASITAAAGQRWVLASGLHVFAVGHCSGLGLVNRCWALQVADWKRIGLSFSKLSSAHLCKPNQHRTEEVLCKVNSRL